MHTMKKMPSAKLSIIITEGGVCWNTQLPILEKINKSNPVTVISYNKPIDNPLYRNIVIHGMSDKEKQINLLKNKDIILEGMEDSRSILVLTDYSSESYFPCNLIKDGHLSVLGIGWIDFMERIHSLTHLTNDSRLQTLAFLEGMQENTVLIKENSIGHELLKKQASICLEKIIYRLSIPMLSCICFYDYKSKRLIEIANRNADIQFSKDDYKYEKNLHPRVDGKKICNKLRQARIDFAKANNIFFESEECPYDGPCAGTCEKCDSELEYLNSIIANQDSVIFPEIHLKKSISTIDSVLHPNCTMGFILPKNVYKKSNQETTININGHEINKKFFEVNEIGDIPAWLKKENK